MEPPKSNKKEFGKGQNEKFVFSSNKEKKNQKKVLVFFENTSDLNFFQCILTYLNKWKLVEENCEFFFTYGKKTFKEYHNLIQIFQKNFHQQQNNNSNTFSSSSSLDHLIIMDNDFNWEFNISFRGHPRFLMNYFKKKLGLNLFVLQKREIENYFFFPQLFSEWMTNCEHSPTKKKEKEEILPSSALESIVLEVYNECFFKSIQKEIQKINIEHLLEFRNGWKLSFCGTIEEIIEGIRQKESISQKQKQELESLMQMWKLSSNGVSSSLKRKMNIMIQKHLKSHFQFVNEKLTDHWFEIMDLPKKADKFDQRLLDWVDMKIVMKRIKKKFNRNRRKIKWKKWFEYVLEVEKEIEFDEDILFCVQKLLDIIES